jgi:hypothetical protein
VCGLLPVGWSDPPGLDLRTPGAAVAAGLMDA